MGHDRGPQAVSCRRLWWQAMLFMVPRAAEWNQGSCASADAAQPAACVMVLT